jgi:hypothetical protein
MFMSSSIEGSSAGGTQDPLPDADPADLTLAEVQRLMELAVRGYGRLLDDGTGGSVLADSHEVTATDAVRAASALLAAVNLQIFELALWETWGGRPWAARTAPGQPTATQDGRSQHA